MISQKSKMRRGCRVWPRRPEVGARSCPALRFLSLSAAVGSGLAHRRGLICSRLPGGRKGKGDGGRWVTRVWDSPELLLARLRWVNAPEMGTGTGDAGGPPPWQHPTPPAPTGLTSAALLEMGVFGVPRGCRRQSPLPFGAAWERKGRKEEKVTEVGSGRLGNPSGCRCRSIPCSSAAPAAPALHALTAGKGSEKLPQRARCRQREGLISEQTEKNKQAHLIASRASYPEACSDGRGSPTALPARWWGHVRPQRGAQPGLAALQPFPQPSGAESGPFGVGTRLPASPELMSPFAAAGMEVTGSPNPRGSSAPPQAARDGGARRSLPTAEQRVCRKISKLRVKKKIKNSRTFNLRHRVSIVTCFGAGLEQGRAEHRQARG